MKKIYSDLKLVKVTKVEFTEEEVEMCDLEVPVNHTFILENGFITHNSANLEVNAIRQTDFLLLKPSSLLQKDFERKKIKDIYDAAHDDFEELKDTVGITYIYSDKFRGFATNTLPTFWSDKVSKGYAHK